MSAGRLMWLRSVSAVLLYVLVYQAHAQQVGSNADWTWLDKARQAARELTYTGVMIYQHGSVVQTSRIFHLADRTGEYEKVEWLDGAPRETLRRNDRIECFVPESKTVFIEPQPESASFPSFAANSLQGIREVYVLRLLSLERIAGLESQVLELEPKDGLRYGHRLWIATGSRLLLKAQTINERREVVEQIAFTEVSIGGRIDKRKIAPSYVTKHWKVENAASQPVDLLSQGWALNALPAGFHKVRELKRKLAGRSEVGQIILSDGFATVSVFIEPYSDTRGALPVTGTQGAINVFARRYGSFWLTVLGEAPPATIQKIAHAVELRGKP